MTPFNLNFGTSMETKEDGSAEVKLTFTDSDGTNIDLTESGTDLDALFEKVFTNFNKAYAEEQKVKEEPEKTKREAALQAKYDNLASAYVALQAEQEKLLKEYNQLNKKYFSLVSPRTPTNDFTENSKTKDVKNDAHLDSITKLLDYMNRIY